MEGSKGEHIPPQSSDQVIPSNLSRPSPTTTKSKYNRGSGLDVVIVGGSELSSQIAFELLRILYFRSVVLLRRSSDRNLHNGFKGEWRAVEYLEDTDEPSQSLLKAVKGANVIISCLGGTGLGAPQRQLVRAAKQSGDCQLFIPSDFSFPHDSVPFSSIYDAKRKVHDLLKRSELPYMSVNCGLFPEVVFHPHSNFGFDVSEKRVTIVGDGNQPVCFTMIVDVARFLGHILETHDIEDLQNKTVDIQGDKKTLREVIKLIEGRTKEKLEVISTSMEEAEESLRHTSTPSTFGLLLRWAAAKGCVDVTKSKDDGPRWREFWPATMPEIIHNMYKETPKKKKKR